MPKPAPLMDERKLKPIPEHLHLAEELPVASMAHADPPFGESDHINAGAVRRGIVSKGKAKAAPRDRGKDSDASLQLTEAEFNAIAAGMERLKNEGATPGECP